MGEIPGVVFIGSGILVFIVSIFTIITDRVEKPFLFYATAVIGLGFVIFGLIRTLKGKKSAEAKANERMQARHAGTLPKDQEIHPDQNIQHHRQSVYQPPHIIQQPQQGQGGAYAKHSQNQNTQQAPIQQHAQQPIQPAHHQRPAQPIPQHQQQQVGGRGKFCHNCGAHLTVHHKFCSNCGARV